MPLMHLEDRWVDDIANRLTPLELLRYRSNLLGSDLRLTNFGGGNTSSKLTEVDPLDGTEKTILWVKGSGGDLGSIRTEGFAGLDLEKVLNLDSVYRGLAFEDEMVDLYPLCAFGVPRVAASIDTPLHAFLPFPHVDHLHPDWAIALAASGNGLRRMHEFNDHFGHRLVWLPWQRPGFELGLMLERAVRENAGCDGVVLGGHGLFTWGETQRESYVNTLTMIDELGQFIAIHAASKSAVFGGRIREPRTDRHEVALQLMPMLRGSMSQQRRLLGSYTDRSEVLEFLQSANAPQLARLGTSCPDHFVRTKIRPLYLDLPLDAQSSELAEKVSEAMDLYRREYAEYYRTHATQDSPAMRNPLPTVVLVPDVGMFSFGKTRQEARITGEFYANAIGVMRGADALDDGDGPATPPQAGEAALPGSFAVFANYVALPPQEAFRIEYWSLEEAKLRRQPAEREFSRQIVLVVGGGNGIGRETALLALTRGAHVVVADLNEAAAEGVTKELRAIGGAECATAVRIDIRDRSSIRQALSATVAKYGGLDLLINTAAIFATSPDGTVSDSQWALTLEVNVTANHLLCSEASTLFKLQSLPASIVLTSSANAVVAKRGSEAYDVSKAALSHLIRELATGLAPLVRVNGISPATVVAGSTMFPRDRVAASLAKYGIPFSGSATDDELRELLSEFYSRRTLTRRSIHPRDCAHAVLFIGGPMAACTTGHLLPVDGGLTEAFLR